MADEKKKRGSNAHKPECQCIYCKLRRMKEVESVKPATEEIPAVEPAGTALPEAPLVAKDAVEVPKATETPTGPEKPVVVPKDSVLTKLPKKQVFLLILGIVLVVLGIGYGIVWGATYRDSENRSAFLGLPAIAAIMGGAYLIIQQRLQNTFQKPDIIMLDGKRIEAPRVQVNSLNMYSNRVAFENVGNPEGQPWRWRQDNRSYFVNKQDDKEKKLKPFELPDQSFYDPRTFAERVLGLPAHQKIFRRREKLLDQLKPVFLGVMIVVVAILMTMTTG